MREVMKIFNKSSPTYWAAHQHLQCKQFFLNLWMILNHWSPSWSGIRIVGMGRCKIVWGFMFVFFQDSLKQHLSRHHRTQWKQKLLLKLIGNDCIKGKVKIYFRFYIFKTSGCTFVSIHMLQVSYLWKWWWGMQSVTSLECILSPKTCLYTGIHKALVNSRGEKIWIRAVKVSCRMLLYLLRNYRNLYEVMQHLQNRSKCADCWFCCWWGS